METQPLLIPEGLKTHEVTVAWKPIVGEPYRKRIFSGTLKGCEQFIRTCERNT